MAKTEKSERKEKREKHSSKDGVHKSKKGSTKTVSPEAAEALIAAVKEPVSDSEGKLPHSTWSMAYRRQARHAISH